MKRNWLARWAGDCSVFVLLLFSFSLYGQIKSQAINNELQNVLTFLGDEASVSALCVNLETSDTLWKYHPRQLLIPASVLKLVTTATALEVLTCDFRYQTFVYIDGSIQDTLLNGNLIVKGGGDPTFGSSIIDDNGPAKILLQIKNALTNRGVRNINGDIIIVDDFYSHPGIPSTRLWEDIGNYFGAIPSGLSYRDNTVNIFLDSPSTNGQLCKVVATEPDLKDITFNCKVVSSVSNRDSAYIYGVSGLKQWMIQGAIPINQKRFKVKAALASPEVCFGAELKDYLQTSAVSVRGVVKVMDQFSNGSKNEVLTSFQSPKFCDIVSQVNTHSNNLMADHLFLTIGKQSLNNPSWDGSRIAVSHFWKSKIDTHESLFFNDGSGLSPKDVISTYAIVNVLSYMSKQTSFTTYYNSLAIGGERGTIRNLWTDTDLKGKIHAKSGSMSGVVAYAGYYHNGSNQLCAFAIIVNNSIKSSNEVRAGIARFIAYSVRCRE